MSLPERLNEELNRLEAEGTLAAPQDIDIRTEGQHVACTLTALGTLGCAVEHVTAYGDKLAGATLDELRAVSESLAGQLTYLLETVAPIECDEQGCTVQMRSDPPHREEDERTYYELLVRRNDVSLRRFRKESRQPRQSVAAQFTREVLVRLASDLAKVVA